MIKLSMPAFDPAQPLTIALHGRAYLPDVLPSWTFHPVWIKFYVDPFVGWVIIDAGEHQAPTVAGLYEYDVSVTIALPAQLGLRGGEGWFSLEAQDEVTFVTDVQVSYTSPVAQDGRAPQTAFA